ncbi:MAG: DUF2357 domain-containing protein [Candidatus Methanoperedens sp.]|nr:DUF2357 domain-containing protein [Candidatus Methanoperedens sp.]CAG0971131.1 hypothetical protein METP1_01248 [Methanosarcinales archaeon]
MATQTSTSDWALKIDSSGSGVFKEYSTEELIKSNILLVEGKFRETKEILFIFKSDGNEKFKLSISGCKDKISREYTDEGDILFRWTPLNYAGVFEVLIEIKTKDKVKRTMFLLLDVLSKLDIDGNSINNFHYMLNSLRKSHIIIYSILNPSRIRKNKGKYLLPDPLEQFEVLERNMKTLENIVYQISLNPNKKLIKETHSDKFYALEIVDHNVIHDIATQRGGLIEAPNDSIAPILQKLLVGYLPDNVLVYRTAQTFNVYENQLLKRFLTLLTICSKQIETRFAQEKNKSSLEQNEIEKIDQYIDKCRQYHRKAQFMKRYPFFEDVQETDNISYNTPILQREVNYMRFYAIFKEFIKNPFFDFSEYLYLPIFDIPKLYEYWVTVHVAEILCNMQNNWKVTQHLFSENDIVFSSRLKNLRTGNNSLVELSNSETHIYLYYQKEYPSYAGRPMIPDITLEKFIYGKPSKILVLDPKYRSNLGTDDDPENAINKMHVYKDAIRGDDGSRIVEAAYAIYLGKNEIKYPSGIMTDGIGGIRLFPKENNAEDRGILKEIIQDFINN